MKQQDAVVLSFVNDYVERLVETPDTGSSYGRDWMRWGTRNTYPQYISELALTTPTLRSVIRGLVDYACGNQVIATSGLSGRKVGEFNTHHLSARELVKKTAKSIGEIGGFAWKITLNADGTVGEIEVLKVKYLRTNEENSQFWYNEKWENGARKFVTYPAWMPGTKEPESILFVKIWGDDTYPEPVFAASVKACETERSIDDYHLGNISRGFMGSYIVNFNSGRIPTKEEKSEIERKYNEKFAGSKNGGRVMFCWNTDLTHKTTLEKMEVSDYGEKYATLSKHCRQQIFTAFGANPNLFGIATESSGFNSEEYESSFKLFNRTMVQPIQQQIIDALELVSGIKGIITIEPFTLEGAMSKIQ